MFGTSFHSMEWPKMNLDGFIVGYFYPNFSKKYVIGDHHCGE